jgi:hypothetical protein
MSVDRIHGVASVLKSLSDDHALSLFRAIATERTEPNTLRTHLKLTPKQYYSRINALSKCNLVKKKDRMLSLTSFGKLVYDAHLTIEKGLDDLIKLKVIDSIETSSGLSKEECDNVVDALIQNKEIKTILEKIEH